MVVCRLGGGASPDAILPGWPHCVVIAPMSSIDKIGAPSPPIIDLSTADPHFQSLPSWSTFHDPSPGRIARERTETKPKGPPRSDSRHGGQLRPSTTEVMQMRTPPLRSGAELGGQEDFLTCFSPGVVIPCCVLLLSLTT